MELHFIWVQFVLLPGSTTLDWVITVMVSDHKARGNPYLRMELSVCKCSTTNDFMNPAPFLLVLNDPNGYATSFPTRVISVVISTTNDFLHSGSEKNRLIEISKISEYQDVGDLHVQIVQCKSPSCQQGVGMLQQYRSEPSYLAVSTSAMIPPSTKFPNSPQAGTFPGPNDPGIFCKMAEFQSSC